MLYLLDMENQNFEQNNNSKPRSVWQSVVFIFLIIAVIVILFWVFVENSQNGEENLEDQNSSENLVKKLDPSEIEPSERQEIVDSIFEVGELYSRGDVSEIREYLDFIYTKGRQELLTQIKNLTDDEIMLGSVIYLSELELVTPEYLLSDEGEWHSLNNLMELSVPEASFVLINIEGNWYAL